jgi:hypothetical protein
MTVHIVKLRQLYNFGTERKKTSEERELVVIGGRLMKSTSSDQYDVLDGGITMQATGC